MGRPPIATWSFWKDINDNDKDNDHEDKDDDDKNNNNNKDDNNNMGVSALGHDRDLQFFWRHQRYRDIKDTNYEYFMYSQHVIDAYLWIIMHNFAYFMHFQHNIDA